MGLPEKEILEKVYGESTKSMERFKMLRKNLRKILDMQNVNFFLLPDDRRS